MINSKKKIEIQTGLRDVVKTPCGLVFLKSKFILDIILQLISQIDILMSSVQILKRKILKNVFEEVKYWALLFFTNLNERRNMMGP